MFTIFGSIRGDVMDIETGGDTFGLGEGAEDGLGGGFGGSG